MTHLIAQGRPWDAWFEGLASDTELRRCVTLRPDPLTDLHSGSPVAACEQLRDAWRNTYTPSDEHLAVIRQLLERARLNAARRIVTAQAFETAIYSQSPVIPQDQEIWGLCGLAGVGKTAAVKAVVRALTPAAQALISPSVLVAPRPAIHATIRAQHAASSVLQSLANPLFTTGRKSVRPAEMANHLRQWLYNQATQLLLVDELQSMTRSEQSSTLIANLLTELNELGPSLVYIFNYSLGHKLLRRPQEDKDRLLVKTLVLNPLASTDPHWHRVVSEHTRIAPKLFNIDAERDAPELYRLTAGLHRLLGDLLLHACHIAWPSTVARSVSMADVRAAYRSGLYASHRDDVEALQSLAFNGRLRESRKDLVCPFADGAGDRGLAETPTRRTAHPLTPTPAAVHMFKSALTMEERSVLAALRGDAANKPTGAAARSATVTRLPRQKRPTAETLLAGARLLTEPHAQPKSTTKKE